LKKTAFFALILLRSVGWNFQVWGTAARIGKLTLDYVTDHDGQIGRGLPQPDARWTT